MPVKSEENKELKIRKEAERKLNIHIQGTPCGSEKKKQIKIYRIRTGVGSSLLIIVRVANS